MLIRLIDTPIDPQVALNAVRHPSCGGVACFEGNVRATNQGKEVQGLAYVVYPELFQAEAGRIIAEAKQKWDIYKVAIIQRIGKLEVGESGIFIAVSSPHRREALDTCSFIIEEFKKRAPVWKKEAHKGSEAWL